MEAKDVYEMFMSDPDKYRSSYLHDHYRRGQQGIMRPSPSAKAADAAWRAGRDRAAQSQ